MEPFGADSHYVNTKRVVLFSPLAPRLSCVAETVGKRTKKKLVGEYKASSVTQCLSGRKETLVVCGLVLKADVGKRRGSE